MSKMIHQQQNKINDLQVKISDLEAKLAESEEMNKILYNEKESAEKILRMSSNEQTREILELQQQLAESENEVQKWKDETMVVKLCELEQQLAEKEKSFDWFYSKWQKCVENKSKTKIEFSIQQLQRVKEEIERRISIINENYHDDIYDEKEKLDMMHENTKIDDFIDQIIKELEGKL